MAATKQDAAPETGAISLMELPSRMAAVQFWFMVLVIFCLLVAAFAMGSILAAGKYEPKLATLAAEKKAEETKLEQFQKTVKETQEGYLMQQQKNKEMDVRAGFLAAYLQYLIAKDKYWTAADEITGAKHKVFPSALVPKDAPETIQRKAALQALDTYLEKLRAYGNVKVENLVVTPQTSGDPATIRFEADLADTKWPLPSELQKQQTK